jgi:uncharacterized protein YqhQ
MPEKEFTRRQTEDKPLPGIMLGVTVAVAFAVGIALFFVTPLVLTSLLFDVDQNPILFNLLAGGIRLALFLIYLPGHRADARCPAAVCLSRG